MSKEERLLAVSIGNTNASFGCFDGEELVGTACFPVRGALAELAWRAPDAVVIGSVNPKATSGIRKALRKGYGIRPVEVGRDLDVPMRNRCRFPGKVGVDRLLNVLAAGRLVSCPAIVADLGTAITIDALSARGDFLGGAILPGASLWAASLHEYTAQLPRVELTRPHQIIGKYTDEAIRSGVYWGIYGAIIEIVGRMRKRLRAPAQLVVTGGDAALFSRHLPEGHVFRPDLTLQGLRIAWSAWREEAKRGA